MVVKSLKSVKWSDVVRWSEWYPFYCILLYTGTILYIVGSETISCSVQCCTIPTGAVYSAVLFTDIIMIILNMN